MNYIFIIIVVVALWKTVSGGNTNYLHI